MTLVFDEVRHETDRAVLLAFDGRNVWIPESLCRDLDADERTVQVQEWFVMREGLEGYEVE